MMVLPGEKYLAEMLDQVDVQKVREVRETLKFELASGNEAATAETLPGLHRWR